ncbi:hypothetical protein KK083_07500 [Fulvivirgaceae bacterium PWU4]|uniref:Peptide-N(4)-(N-acetyl-beta-glucosaminyl)asparagine amidase n=1 Tax=Chryseosolibacter histidini TaxID=2782349 RepID=A0AAP2GMA0_9BACT|nr:discoidin domain-containing protein [Chryseosolibacter histidini]MBT1696713.1 hypothetical protein [Chryseosolibacter histidini]
MLLVLVSCGGPPDGVQGVLRKAGENRPELEKVIEHFSRSGDEEKLKAAYFLIENMEDKVALDGKHVRNYDIIFEILDSLHRNKVRILPVSPVVQHVWDSLTGIYGAPSLSQAHPVPDHRVIKSRYLIESIEQAFKVRQEADDAKNIDFDQFCEYILPYRIGTERLEPWREHLRWQYATLRDSLKGKSRVQIAEAINTHLKSFLYTNHTLWSYPFDVPVSKMEKGKRGACKHIVFYTAMVMRANGLPVGIDMVPRWGNHSKGHEWNVLLQENGEHFPFDAARTPFGGIREYPYKPAKVFRMTFASQKERLPPQESNPEDDIPVALLDPYYKDVTAEYTKTYDVRIELTQLPDAEKRYALICTFDSREWEPLDFGRIEGKHAVFKNMGTGIVYLAMYLQDGVLSPASNPFTIDTNGAVRYLSASPSLKQDMTLTRKFPCFPSTQEHLKTMIGGRFQGANKADFSDSVNLFTVTTIPAHRTVTPVSSTSTYRYIRYISPYNKRACVAELAFFGGRKKTDTTKLHGRIIGYPEVSPHIGNFYHEAFDGKLETYFQGGAKNGYGWAGLDLGTPQHITSISYCPRSDTNFIVEGDTYELFIWLNGGWQSMGRQVANEPLLRYKQVPAGGLYVLHNLSRGKEERIFTYDDGHQVWF